MFGLNSETLSGLAILFSILGTILSIFYTNLSIVYTKRQFEAAFHPRISLQVHERSCGSGLKTCLAFILKNHSNDRAAINVRLRAALSLPTSRWLRWTAKWHYFMEKDNFEIAPDKMKETQPSARFQAEGLEGFLLKQFPQLVYPENDPDTPEEVAFKKPVEFLLRVHVTYKPAILKAKDIPLDFYYILIPHFRRNNGDPYCLNYWEIKELKAK